MNLWGHRFTHFSFVYLSIKLKDMKKELTHVVCIKSDWQKYFEVGEIYELKDNIPINKEGVKMVYTWDNHIRTTNINLAQFKKK